MYISTKDWKNYIQKLSALDEKAGELMQEWIRKNGFGDTKALTDYAYAVATKYGEGSASLAAAMYDAIAEVSGKFIEAAEVAATPAYGEVAKTVNGTLKSSQNPNTISNAISRLVKRTGADTMLKNAERDKAQFAWVPNGDTCAFCIALASRGWQDMSSKALKGGHAEHIHANCDCTYAVRFDKKSGVAGYDPQKYEDMYYGAEGSTPQERINSLRRMRYAERKDVINAQKRAAYAVASEKERLQRSYSNTVRMDALDAPGYIEKFQGITGVESVDNAIYESAKEILDHRKGTDFEDLFLIDAETGNPIHKLTTCDIPNGVDYDSATIAAIEQAHENHQKIIAIHNHPGGLPPTLDDGVSAYDHNYVKGIAVGHNLELYEYGATDQHYSREQCEALHDEIAKAAAFSIDFEDNIWYDALRSYGMAVKRK